MAIKDQMLSRIDVRNFKSIYDVSIDLRQLTVLVGENSAGKSSLIQAIFLLAQIARSRSRPDVVSLNGMELNLGNFVDVLHSGSPGQQIEIGLTVPAGSSLSRRRFRVDPSMARRASRPRQDDSDEPVEDEASWFLSLGNPVDELGVARIEKIAVTDLRQGVTLEVLPNDQREEVGELYLRARRLGLIRGTPARRSRLVSDLDRATQFAGVISAPPAPQGVSEDSGNLPAVAVENGFPVELYEPENELGALARLWVDLVMRRTEFELRRPRRDVEERGARQSLMELRRQRRVEKWSGPQPGEVAEILFPDFRRWVDELDRSPEGEIPRTVEPIRDDILSAVVGVEESIAWELSHLLESVRVDRGILTSRRSSTLDIAQGLGSLLSEAVHYLGPLREDPSPSYRPGQGGGVATLGVKGEFTVAALSTYRNQETMCPLARGDILSMRLEEAVDHWAERFGFASKIRTQDKGRAGIELELIDSQTGSTRDLTSVGVGVSQLLPVIVLCLLAQPGELVLIEQPELHLHPAPQQVLGDFLLGIAESGRQLIVETHSEYLINRLRLRIAEEDFGQIGDLVQLWYAKRADGRTRFDLLRPNRFGSFEDWPEGFFDQAPRDAEAILRAAAQKRRSDRGSTGVLRPAGSAGRRGGNFAEVWARIVAHAGEIFFQKGGGEFTYNVEGNAVIPDRTNRRLPRSDFSKALERMPVEGPGALQDLQGPSYVWAILSDDRIRSDAVPQGNEPESEIVPSPERTEPLRKVIHRWGKPPDATNVGASATGWLGYDAEGHAVYYLRRDLESGAVTLFEADESGRAKSKLLAEFENVRRAHESLLAPGVTWQGLQGSEVDDV